ncbi:kinase-like domain-containing protein [Mycena floridula]|nr:kinase-like domain-containing protein [Mycena floridula]
MAAFNPLSMIKAISQRLFTRNLTSQIRPVYDFPVANGGDADIYKSQISDTLEVALKVYRGVNDPLRTFKRLQKEVSILNSIPSHPNIAEIYGVCLTGPYNQPTLVLRWYENGSASTYLAGKDFNTKLAVIRGIARGLQHLHFCRIVHGDLKGRNVLITDDGRPVLSDFGLSQILDRSTGFTTFSPWATSHWLAPEIFVALKRDQLLSETRSFASDIWALACTAYELLTGNIPFPQLGFNTLSRCVRHGGIPLLDTDHIIHGHLAIHDLLLACWSMQPSQRPSIDEFIRRLP